MMTKLKSGLSIVEFLVILSIIFLLSALVLNTFIDLRKYQSLKKDTEIIVEVLNQARSQTISSLGSTQYGVHMASSKVTLFSGSSYDPASTTNKDYPLSSTDTILTITLAGGGSDVIFQRLSGETLQDGTIVISSPTTSKTESVTIYKTGIVEST